MNEYTHNTTYCCRGAPSRAAAAGTVRSGSGGPSTRRISFVLVLRRSAYFSRSCLVVRPGAAVAGELERELGLALGLGSAGRWRSRTSRPAAPPPRPGRSRPLRRGADDRAAPLHDGLDVPRPGSTLGPSTASFITGSRTIGFAAPGRPRGRRPGRRLERHVRRVHRVRLAVVEHDAHADHREADQPALGRCASRGSPSRPPACTRRDGAARGSRSRTRRPGVALRQRLDVAGHLAVLARATGLLLVRVVELGRWEMVSR